VIDAAGKPPGTHARGLDAAGASGTIVLVVGDSMSPSRVLGLCESLRRLLEGGNEGPVVCDLGTLVGPDAGTVDTLARLQLTARRLGRQIRLRHAPHELQDLLALMGLCEVLPLCETLALEPGG
jgi:ABC-type transporter Mla MlaB component